MITCCPMPVFWILMYSWTAKIFKAYETEKGVWKCKIDPQTKEIGDVAYIYWIVLYFFIPAFLITTLNTAIAVQINRIQRSSHAALTSLTKKISMK